MCRGAFRARLWQVTSLEAQESVSLFDRPATMDRVRHMLATGGRLRN
jgi:hypothetical protein